MKIRKEISNTKSNIKKLREELKEKSKIFFKEESQKLFNENPDLKMFGWTQYTPHYNDGETCYFSAHTDYPIYNWIDEQMGKFADEEMVAKYFGKDANFEKLSEKFEGLSEKVVAFLSSFNDEDLEDMFGDHASVVVTRDGVEIEEYEHD